MKALMKARPGRGLSMTEVPAPEAAYGSVLIKVLRTGICGTDLHIDQWDSWAQSVITAPLVPGHEFVGEVVDVGDGVDVVGVGDIVSGEGHLVCGRCRNCRAGRRHLCIRTVGIGVNIDGAFAEYVAIPQENVWIHREAIDLDVAAIFDPFGNAVHTALSFPVVNEDVLVTGAGPIGILAAATARRAGARCVVVTDVSPYRLALARRMGATTTVDVTRESLREAMEANDMVEGFDVALEMSGRPDALADAISTMSPGGKIALLGLPSSGTTIDLGTVVTKMLTLQGIYGRQMFDTWYAMSGLLRSGLDISPLVTHRFGFEEHRAAFDTARSGRCGKVVIDWTTARLG
ncbi:L-threonine 3-dehydrogenase [Aeromicrobium endophyticum]|uniref:L-threonine 3-dehydrogenase n=1 Tax=Aeromicrobium endophyticum TaxID=2292704 RepID=A0A371NYZ1_9ACTN|nr:L-threonine 3-dehydrogenase [Aeromicrobium endophyticum]REK68903.1 L-threonine 3-dehydrogenase [Aeromicrobium endophyticum]